MSDDFDIMGLLDDTPAEPVKPKSAEESFCYLMLMNSEARLAGLIAWLRYQVAMYWYLVELQDVTLVKTNTNALGVKTKKDLGYNDAVKLYVKYYLLANYMHHFQAATDSKDRKVCDIDVVVEMILTTESIKKMISDYDHAPTRKQVFTIDTEDPQSARKRY